MCVERAYTNIQDQGGPNVNWKRLLIDRYSEYEADVSPSMSVVVIVLFTAIDGY